MDGGDQNDAERKPASKKSLVGHGVVRIGRMFLSERGILNKQEPAKDKKVGNVLIYMQQAIEPSILRATTRGRLLPGSSN
jgi:hypothetical protein